MDLIIFNALSGRGTRAHTAAALMVLWHVPVPYAYAELQ